MKLKNKIVPKSDFQYSVNIDFDLNSEEKIKGYIPTIGGLNIIEDVMLSTIPNSKDRARLFVGAYGKGKSHLVLTILSLLSKKDKSLFTTVLNKAKEKNVEFLIESHKDLLDKKYNVKLIIVGDGPDKEAYEELSRKLGIDKDVIFTGKASWKDMPYYYHIADVFATASKTETQGLTVIEAMASNVVPVCMRDEAFQSMVTEDLNGLFFETKDEYKKQIEFLYKNPKELKRIDSQARVQAEHYGSRNYAISVLEVYERAIKTKEAEYRFGIFSKVYQRIKEMFK